MERSTKTIPCNTAANRVEFGDELIHLAAALLRIDSFLEARQVQRWSLSLREKIWIVSISIRDHANVNWPLDAKGGVIPPYPFCVSRRVEFRHLIKDFGVVFESEKPVGKPFWDVEQATIFCRKLYSHAVFKR